MHCESVADEQVSSDTQRSICAQGTHADWSALSRYPDAQLVQTDAPAVVHVRAELQFGTGVHWVQRSSACDSSSHLPDAH